MLQQLSALVLSPAQLGSLVRNVAAAAEWPGLVRFGVGQRWYRRLELTETYEVWLLSWLPGQHTGFHDHGEACGAFAVVRGELAETLAQPGRTQTRMRIAGQGN